jgi:hypothetical protein
MKHIYLFTALFASAVACSHASEVGFPKIGEKKSAQASTSTIAYNGQLKASQFTSSVDGQQNSWRSVLRESRGSVEIGLKTGNWDRPDRQKVDAVWLSHNYNWAEIAKSNKTIRIHYVFGASTDGVTSRLRFGANQANRKQTSGNYALTLTYGEKNCTFSVGSQDSSGELSKAVTEGTEVTINLNPDGTASILIDDSWILDGQVVDLDSNYFTLSAINEEKKNPDAPKLLYLSKFEVTLVNP